MKKILFLSLVCFLPMSSYANCSWGLWGNGCFFDTNPLKELKNEVQASADTSAMKDSAAANKAQIKAYQAEVKATDTEINRTQSRLQGYQTSIQNTESAINSIEGVIQNLKAQQIARRNNLKNLKAKLDEKKTKSQAIAGVKAEKNTISNRLSDARSQRKALIKETKKYADIRVDFSDDVKPEKRQEAKDALERIELEIGNLDAQISTDSALLNQKNDHQKKLQEAKDKIKTPGYWDDDVEDIEDALAELQAEQDANTNTLKAKKKHLEAVRAKLKADQEKLATQGKKLDEQLAKVGESQTADQQLKTKVALLSTKDKIRNILSAGDRAEVRADMMFSNLEDIYAQLTNDGADKAFVLENLKDELVKNLDNTPVGLYVSEKIAELKLKKEADFCSKKKTCDEIEAAGIDLRDAKAIEEFVKANPEAKASKAKAN